MATSSSPTAPKSPAPENKQGLLPPEEQFWQRYSPHHEAPLSGITSFAIHVLAIPLMLLIGWLVIKLGLGQDTKPVPVDVVQMLGGGGGSPRGQGTGGSDAGSQPMPGDERGDNTDDAKKPETQPPNERPRLSPADATQVASEFNDDPTVKRLIQEGTAASQGLFALEQGTREKLRRNVNPGAGQGGSGTDGGKDTGKDKGTGAGRGPGKANLNQREKRILRWAMTFNTRDGRDYANQLQGLGAILAMPLADGKRFEVIRDLSRRPAKGKEEDIAAINRIFWVDDRPESVRSLAIRGLGLSNAPSFFVAFFPEELEEKLLRMELEWMEKKAGRRNEEDIHETRFNVINMGGGKYDVRVAGQTLK